MCVHWQQTWQWTILMGRKFRHLQNSAATCFVQRAAQELSRLLSAVCRLVKIVLGNKFSKASKTGTRKGKAQICTGLLDVGYDSITAPPGELRILHVIGFKNWDMPTRHWHDFVIVAPCTWHNVMTHVIALRGSEGSRMMSRDITFSKTTLIWSDWFMCTLYTHSAWYTYIYIHTVYTTILYI